MEAAAHAKDKARGADQAIRMCLVGCPGAACSPEIASAKSHTFNIPVSLPQAHRARFLCK